ncbi:MAG: efflux RND transporter permease subunit [Verrucomicrobiales bacterium]|nr:efflux RND transporter permease subunit [Verrucomicrobiales bacterium]
MMARFFIERPVLANVIALVTLLLGGLSLFRLPVAQYPPITPPTIQVTATYPGANARTLMDTVALPIEQQVNGVEGMLYLQSTSTSDGRYTLTVTFRVGTDLDLAQVLVQNRVSAALAQLPGAVQQQGVVTKKKSTAILQIITLTSTNADHDALFLANYATLRLRDRLARVPGVSDVSVFGIGDYSMRIWLDPELLRQRSLMPADVLAAIQQQSARVPAGRIGMAPAPAGVPFSQTLEVDSTRASAEEFGDIVVRFSSDPAGEVVRLRDVARIELGAKTYSQFFQLDGRVAGGIAIYQLPDANALDTAERVRRAMDALGREFPPGLRATVPFDTTRFVRASVDEVYHTIAEAGVLVLLVIILFLQNGRATLVPATTVPVTLVGSFAALALLGFSLNLLTLFALVLAVGVVVDDAIVVVEGTVQEMERGRSPLDASVASMRALLGPILGVTLVLMSVFLPPAFLPGITGQMYRQFALVMAATALISALNAATLKPAQCALWLRPPDPRRRPGRFFRVFNAAFGRFEDTYAAWVSRLVRHRWLAVGMGLGVAGIAVAGLGRVPTGFIPTEDQGYVMVTVQLPDGASLERTAAATDRIVTLSRELPAVAHTIVIGGMSPLDANASLANAGIVYLMLRDWKERGRGEDLRSVYEALTRRLENFPEARTMVLVPPPIQGLGLSGGFQMQLELTDGSGDFVRLQQVADQIVDEARRSPVIRMALTPLRALVPQLSVDINRTRAESLGVSVGDAQETLATYLGSSFANFFTLFGHTYTVYAQADSRFRRDPSDLTEYAVRSQSGAMVPLGSLATVRPTRGPAVVTLYNLRPSATINGAARDGHSSGEALTAMEAIAARVVPPGMTCEWTAMSYQEKLAEGSSIWVFGLSLLLVFLVLAGQFESWRTPLTVILAVPLALVGTVTALLGTGVANNLYVQIGLVLLIALSAKNSILIVGQARSLLDAGKPLESAIVEAARLRFRPILMTSLTCILGVLPLLVAEGAGSSARKSLGLTVASGMLASTVLAVLFVPPMFALLRGRPSSVVAGRG